MYSYNSSKKNYFEISRSLEIYKVQTTIVLEYNHGNIDSDAEKDFDHLRQLINIYDRILFFTGPVLINGKYEFKFGVEQIDLFKLKNDDTGVLRNRLNNLVMFNDIMFTQGVNTNTWIYKL